MNVPDVKGIYWNSVMTFDAATLLDENIVQEFDPGLYFDHQAYQLALSYDGEIYAMII